MPGRRSICLYTPSTEPSGMGQHMLDLAEEFLPAHDVSLMVRPTTGGRRMLDRAAALGVATLALPCPRDPEFAAAVTGFLADRPADVFHCHVGTGAEDWDGVRLARAAGCRAVLQTQHLPYLLAHPRKRAGFHHGIEAVDRVIAVSDGVRRSYERIGVPAGRIVTVPNGIAPLRSFPSRVAARRRLGLDPDRPLILTIGRLTQMKGQEILVDAVPALARRFATLAVILVGDGRLRDRLVDRARALGVARQVCFPGHLPDARLLLPAADVFVLPSRHEGMPLAAIEAMDAGLPVVGTRVIGTDEVIVDGETGALVPPRNPTALARALERLLADPELRRRQGAAGRRRFLACFTRERMAARTSAVYDQVLREVTGVRDRVDA